LHFAFKGFHRYSSSSNYNQRNQSHKPNIWRNVCQNAKKFHSIPIILRSTNFDDSLRELAYEVTKQALETYVIENEVASHIKRRFDAYAGPPWHCIVGRNFGSHVEYDLYIHFSYDRFAIILFKCG
uniref:Dynein light chain n=1 Tax=Dracunculus medinensis TaxID=318479 RepID=A0A0N4UNQ2_DRAME